MGRVVSYNDEVPKCTFCGKTEHQVRKLVTGQGAAICDECIELCVSIISDERIKDVEVNALTLPKPMQINAYLDRYVIGQQTAKRALSVAVYNHYKRVNMEMREAASQVGETGGKHNASGNDPLRDVQVAKSNILLLGPTGVGKTYLAQTLAKVMNVPFVITDATTLTEAGYVGDDVETVLQRLMQAADGDVSGTRKHREQEAIQIDTRGILFICGGAFVGLTDIIKNRLGARESGFGAKWHDHEVPDEELLQQVCADDLAEFGLLPEFIGRLPVISVLQELKEDDLAAVLTQPSNALIKQYMKLFAVDGVTLTFTDDAIAAIARTAIRQGTGARGLRSIIERTLQDTMFQLPSLDHVIEVVVDGDAVLGEGNPRIIRDEKNVDTQSMPSLGVAH